MDARHRAAYSESDGWMNYADFALQNVSTLREDASKGSDDELAALGLDWRLSAAVGILDHGEASLAKTRTEKTLYTSGILMEVDFVAAGSL